MNGRVYDPGMGRFLSVDPVIQSPGNSQSLNPYSYIMNNPLAGTDPTGYTACGEGPNKCDAADLEKMDKDEFVEAKVISSGKGQVTLKSGEKVDVTFKQGISKGSTTIQEGGTPFSESQNIGASSKRKNTKTSSNQSENNDFSNYVTTENGIPINNFERESLANGNIVAFWQSRHDRGDPWAIRGLSIWDPENSALTPEDLEMGKRTLGILRRALEIRFLGSEDFNKNPSPKFLRKLVDREIKIVGQNIATFHAEFSQNDYVKKLGDIHGVLDVYQGAIYHHKAFERSKLFKNTYGGTPLGGFAIQEQSEFINDYIAPMLYGKGYCVGCDTHHRSPE